MPRAVRWADLPRLSVALRYSPAFSLFSSEAPLFSSVNSHAGTFRPRTLARLSRGLVPATARVLPWPRHMWGCALSRPTSPAPIRGTALGLARRRRPGLGGAGAFRT